MPTKNDPMTVSRIVARIEEMARQEHEDAALLPDDPENATQRIWHQLRAEVLLEASVDVCRAFAEEQAGA